MSEADPWAIDETGLTLALRVTPRASRSAFAGRAEGHGAVAVRVAAPPVEGAANEALLAFLGKQLGVRARDVVLVSGGTGRLKRVRITGDGARIAARLRLLLGEA